MKLLHNVVSVWVVIASDCIMLCNLFQYALISGLHHVILSGLNQKFCILYCNMQLLHNVLKSRLHHIMFSGVQQNLYYQHNFQCQPVLPIWMHFILTTLLCAYGLHTHMVVTLRSLSTLYCPLDIQHYFSFIVGNSEC